MPNGMKLAFCFPGQGSQYVGMGKDIYREYELDGLYDRANEVLGFDLRNLIFEGPEEELTLTENAQPAILLDSVAKHRIAADRYTPDIMLGHSLGEYSALVCAGVIDLEDGLRLVRARGRYMQEAVPIGEGTMAAVIGLEIEEIEDICQQIEGVVEVANYNSPTQIVISGKSEMVEKAGDEAERRGAKKVIPLDVSAPFHSVLMQPAEERLAEDIRGVEFSSPCCPVISTVSGRPETSPSRIKELLTKQVTASVMWVDYIKVIDELGVERILEVGPGQVLTRLLKRMKCSIVGMTFEEAMSDG